MLNEFRQNMQVIAPSRLSHSSILPSSFFCRPVVLTHYISFLKTSFNSTPLWAQLFSISAFNQKYNHKVGWVSSSCENFFSKYYAFPLSSKPTLPSSNSIWNAQTCFNYFLRTLKCYMGKQITVIIIYYYLQSIIIYSIFFYFLGISWNFLFSMFFLKLLGTFSWSVEFPYIHGVCLPCSWL